MSFFKPLTDFFSRPTETTSSGEVSKQPSTSCIPTEFLKGSYVTLKKQFSPKMAAEIAVISVLIIVTLSAILNGHIMVGILGFGGIAADAWILHNAYLKDPKEPLKIEEHTEK